MVSRFTVIKEHNLGCPQFCVIKACFLCTAQDKGNGHGLGFKSNFLSTMLLSICLFTGLPSEL